MCNVLYLSAHSSVRALASDWESNLSSAAHTEIFYVVLEKHSYTHNYKSDEGAGLISER